MWLGDQLGIQGAVLPATIEPTKHHIEEAALTPPPAEAADQPRRPVRRLRFEDGRTDSPQPAVAAIRTAQWVVLAPGGLYRDILSTCAVPDLADALTRTAARVVWIANLEPDPREAPGFTAIDHVLALHAHGVRVDAVLHDPSAGLGFDASELEAIGVESVTRRLRSTSSRGTHDPERLRTALTELLAPRSSEQPPSERAG
jgi:uncharacterized cofD-like protein